MRRLDSCIPTATHQCRALQPQPTPHDDAGLPQTCHYNDGMGDVLPILLSTAAFVLGKTMLLLCELQSIAVRVCMRYAPHPYVWMLPVAQ